MLSSLMLLSLIGIGGCAATSPRGTRYSPEMSLVDDAVGIPGGVWRDLRETFSKPRTYYHLGGAYLGAELLDSSGLNFLSGGEASHSLGKGVSKTLAWTGKGSTLLGASAALYAFGYASQSEEHYSAGKAALAALASTGLVTLAAKQAFADERPNGGGHAFPSGHSSMMMAFSTSLNESYGWRVGVPLFLTTAAVAYQRVDSGAHSADDVAMGLALGYVLASGITRRRNLRFLGGEVGLYASPGEGRTGIRLSWGF